MEKLKERERDKFGAIKCNDFEGHPIDGPTREQRKRIWRTGAMRTEKDV